MIRFGKTLRSAAQQVESENVAQVPYLLFAAFIQTSRKAMAMCEHSPGLASRDASRPAKQT
jgi:hypothetical protein